MLEKHFLRDDRKVEVEFSLPKSLVDNKIDSVLLVGDFNGWDRTGAKRIVMKKAGNTFKIRILLEMNREYKYKYLLFIIDENSQMKSERWEIDWHADKYIPSPIDRSSDSVIITHDFEKRIT